MSCGSGGCGGGFGGCGFSTGGGSYTSNNSSSRGDSGHTAYEPVSVVIGWMVLLSLLAGGFILASSANGAPIPETDSPVSYLS